MLDNENSKVTRSSKKIRKNKELLQSEINNATDPTVRLELTKMLLDLENKEKKTRVRNFCLVIIVIIGILVSLYFLGRKPAKTEDKTLTTTKISSTQTSSSTKESVDFEKQLSTKQLEEWVLAVLEYAPEPPTKYVLRTSVNDKDKLAYVSVGIDQTDGMGTFRVNAKGQLEYKPNMSMGDWQLISEKYMDTSLASEYFREQRETQEKAKEESKQKEEQMTFREAAEYVISNSDKWMDLSDEEKEELKIISVNESLNQIRTDRNVDYYMVVLETNKEPRGVMASGEQFRVYIDGDIEQRSMGAGRDEWISLGT